MEVKRKTMKVEALFKCQECGKKFATLRAAEKASWSGCPKCGGCDVDIA